MCFLSVCNITWSCKEVHGGGGNVGEGNLVNCVKGFGVLSWMRSDEGNVTWGSGVRWGGGLW